MFRLDETFHKKGEPKKSKLAMAYMQGSPLRTIIHRWLATNMSPRRNSGTAPPRVIEREVANLLRNEGP